jgi:hypothetical protein
MVPPMVAEAGMEITAIADPIPQALMITSVVLGVSVQAVCLVLTMITFSEYGTLDWSVAQRIREGVQAARPAEAASASALLFNRDARRAAVAAMTAGSTGPLPRTMQVGTGPVQTPGAAQNLRHGANS